MQRVHHNREDKLKPTAETILIVDDDAIIRDMLRTELEAAGFSVIETENPALVLQMVMQQSPDAVILDVTMPLLDGDRLAGLIVNFRASSESQVKVFFFSSRPPDELQAMVDAVGVDGFFEKKDGAAGVAKALPEALAKST